jgi:hypothetical protein
MMRLRDMVDFARKTFCLDVKRARDGEQCKVEVDGIVCGALGVHIANDRAHVTHLATGLRVASFTTLGGAVEFVNCTGAITWEGHLPLQLQQDLKKLAEEIEAASPRPKEVAS